MKGAFLCSKPFQIVKLFVFPDILFIQTVFPKMSGEYQFNSNCTPFEVRHLEYGNTT